LDASPATRAFLEGRHSEDPRWNERLFSAACDLAARGLVIDKATDLLLAGARPWNAGEEESAVKTILSAYSRPREPARR
jgi:hypothetical protein